MKEINIWKVLTSILFIIYVLLLLNSIYISKHINDKPQSSINSIEDFMQEKCLRNVVVTNIENNKHYVLTNYNDDCRSEK